MKSSLVNTLKKKQRIVLKEHVARDYSRLVSATTAALRDIDPCCILRRYLAVTFTFLMAEEDKINGSWKRNGDLKEC